MPDIHRFALVPYTPTQMFDLVQDVAAYPEFLSWINQATVHAQTPQTQHATLGLSLAGLRPTFSTHNTLNRPESVTMTLDQGPFQRLSGEWRFEPMGSGCKVSLDLSFEMAKGLLSQALAKSFGRVADRMVDDFCRRAVEVYGDES